MKLVLLVIIGVLVIWPAVCYSQESMELPFLPGETWLCSRGYNTATHRDYGNQWVDDRYALDFVLSGCLAYRKPILATHSGIIAEVGRNDSYGDYLLVEEDNGKRQRYAHNNNVIVGKGERVVQGQVISFCGNSGAVEGQACASHPGTHLHYAGYDEHGDGLVPEPISNYTGMHEGVYYTSRNTVLLDQAYNRYGSAMIGYPEYQMWEVDLARQHNSNHPWYYHWDPNDLYDNWGLPRNCVIWHFDGGFFGDNAVVYDAQGGARAAIVLHSGLWTFWTQRGGPRCPAKMPIRDESNVPANLRNYYRDNYKENGVTRLDGITAIQECQDGVMFWNGSAHFAWYPYCAPGYFEDGWHADASYLIVECFNRNGGSQKLGHAVPIEQSPSRVHNWHGYQVQDFNGSTNGWGVIMYDPQNWVGNTCATNEAYYMYGSIWSYYRERGSVDLFGCPTIDQYELGGLTVQDFHNRFTGQNWRIKSNGSHELLDPCGESEAQGGDDPWTQCIPDPNSILANGDFSDGTDCWEYFCWPEGRAELHYGNNTVELEVHGSGDFWQVQFGQGCSIVSGQNYLLEYDYESVNTLRVFHSLTDPAEHTAYYGLWDEFITDRYQWYHKAIPFTANTTTSNAEFIFYLGQSNGKFRIRNVVISPVYEEEEDPPPPPVECEPDPGNMIANSDFSSGMDCHEYYSWPAENSVLNAGDYMVELDVRVSAQDWQVQFRHYLAVVSGQRYRVGFEYESVNTLDIVLALLNTENHSLNYGLNERFRTQRYDWYTREFEFTANATDATTMLVFKAGEDIGKFRMRRLWMYPIESQEEDPPPPPPSCDSDDPGSFIGNGHFNGPGCWTVEHPNLPYVVSNFNGQFEGHINGPHEWYEVKLYQTWVYLTAGADLEAVWTGAVNAPSTAVVSIEDSHGNHLLWEEVALTSTEQRFALPFRSNVTDPNGKLTFYLGWVDQSVWLKDVKVRFREELPLPPDCQRDPGSYLGNGDFSTPGACWVAEYPSLPWADLTFENNSAWLLVNGGANWYEYDFYQPGIPLTSGRNLKLGLTLLSDQNTRVIIGLGDEAADTWVYWKEVSLKRNQYMSVTDTIQVSRTIPAGALHLYAGEARGSVWVKQARLVELALAGSIIGQGLALSPNPMNQGEEAEVRFSLEQESLVELNVYDVTGRRVRNLVNQILARGSHIVVWSGQNSNGQIVPSGIYFVKLESREQQSQRRLIIVH